MRPEISREFDLLALDQFLTYEYVMAPRTMFTHIRKAAGGALPASTARARSRVASLLGRAADTAGARVGRRRDAAASRARRPTPRPSTAR